MKIDYAYLLERVAAGCLAIWRPIWALCTFCWNCLSTVATTGASIWEFLRRPRQLFGYNLVKLQDMAIGLCLLWLVPILVFRVQNHFGFLYGINAHLAPLPWYGEWMLGWIFAAVGVVELCIGILVFCAAAYCVIGASSALLHLHKWLRS